MYYWLAKPGIVYGNLLTASAGFFLASQGNIDFKLLGATLGGISTVIASACVFNNYIDRNIDKKMARTKKRALASEKISIKSALIYGSILGSLGFFLLAVFTNLLTVLMGIIAMTFYLFIYGIAKRRSPYGTLVGSIPGALPPVAGYTAVTGRLDTAAILLFLILVFWQMPHFYAISIFRIKEYKAANIPVWPIAKGYKSTKTQILTYMLGFLAAVILLAFYGYASYFYLIIMILIALKWLHLAIAGFSVKDDQAWARQIFRFSLLVLLIFSLSLSLDSTIF